MTRNGQPSRRGATLPPVVVFYVSGHGFGHASRAIEVINALIARRPDVAVQVRTSASRWLFDLTVRGAHEFVPVLCDTGVVQVDSLHPDVPATLVRAGEFYADFDARAQVEADALRAAGARLVVADAPPLAFEAAARAGVPSVLFGNFTWDWIYGEYVDGASALAWLPGRLNRAYRLAAEAWRLPMWGGFDGVEPVVDLPFVARRSSRDPRELRDALGIEEGRAVALASFGGVGLEGLPLDGLARTTGDWILLTTDVPTRVRRPGADGLARRTAAGVVVLDEHALYANGFRYEDVVVMADVVVTKPGYGIIAECIANGTAMLYTSRGAFAEYDVLVREMPKYLRCAFIDHADLKGGRWLPHLEALVRGSAPAERPRVDGAEVAAGLADRWLA